MNRDSGTESANGGWLRRLVRRRIHKPRYSFLSQRQQKRSTAGKRRNKVNRLYPHIRFRVDKRGFEYPNAVSFTRRSRILANPRDLGITRQWRVAVPLEPPVINLLAIDDVTFASASIRIMQH